MRKPNRSTPSFCKRTSLVCAEEFLLRNPTASVNCVDLDSPAIAAESESLRKKEKQAEMKHNAKLRGTCYLCYPT